MIDLLFTLVDKSGSYKQKALLEKEILLVMFNVLLYFCAFEMLCKYKEADDLTYYEKTNRVKYAV